MVDFVNSGTGDVKYKLTTVTTTEETGVLVPKAKISVTEKPGESKTFEFQPST